MNSKSKIKPFEIHEIADKKIVNGRLRYLVKWRQSDYNTWEPAERLSLHDIQRFEAKCDGRNRSQTDRAVRRETRTRGSIMSETTTKKEERGKNSSLVCDRCAGTHHITECITDLIKTQLQCSICLEVYKEVCVTSCGHLFCNKCLEKWRNNHCLCPICRKPILCSNKVPDLNNFLTEATTLLNVRK